MADVAAIAAALDHLAASWSLKLGVEQRRAWLRNCKAAWASIDNATLAAVVGELALEAPPPRYESPQPWRSVAERAARRAPRAAKPNAAPRTPRPTDATIAQRVAMRERVFADLARRRAQRAASSPAPRPKYTDVEPVVRAKPAATTSTEPPPAERRGEDPPEATP